MASPLKVSVVEMMRQVGTLKDIEVSIPVADFGFADPRIDEVADIDVALRLESVNGGIVVRGTVTGQSLLVCGRCLKGFVSASRATVDELYQMVPDNQDAYPIEGESLDLGPMVRETALLSLPTAPLCTSDCPGLCLQCGADLGTAKCGCVAEESDLRWAVLDHLRQELN